jgi:hypothetical protein
MLLCNTIHDGNFIKQGFIIIKFKNAQVEMSRLL